MENEKSDLLKKIGCLFYRYGIKSVSMDDIAKELGISKKTLYVHFKDKREIVSEVLNLQGCMSVNALALIGSNATNAMEQYLELISLVRSWIEEMNPSFDYDLEKYYPDLDKAYELKRVENMTKFCLDNLSRGKKEGVYREDFDAEIITKFHVATITNIHVSGLFSMPEMYSYEIYRQYFMLFMRGIASQKGLLILEKKIEEYGFNNTLTNK